MTYFQAIPIYTKEDDAAFRYFREHHADLDSITGTAIAVGLPETVLHGNADDVAKALESGGRYPGLRPDDLPCLWVEDESGGHTILSLPEEGPALVRRLRQITAAARSAKDVHDLVRALPNGQQSTEGVPKQIWIPALCFTAAVLLFMMWAFVERPNLTGDQRSFMQAFFAVLAGFASSFMTGTALFQFTHTSRRSRFLFSGTAGLAMFALCLVWPPFFREASAVGKVIYEYGYTQDGKAFTGVFENLEANGWTEYTTEANRDLTYHFREVDGEPGWITLYDSARGSYVRFRREGGVAQYATMAEGPWANIHTVRPRRRDS